MLMEVKDDGIAGTGRCRGRKPTLLRLRNGVASREAWGTIPAIPIV